MSFALPQTKQDHPIHMKRCLHLVHLWILLIGSLSLGWSQIYEIKQGNKWGFIDSSGQIVVPLQYDFVFDDELSQQDLGYFVFLKGKKMGVFHLDRQEIVSASYDRIKVHGDASLAGYIEVQLNGKIGVLDTLGNILLPPKYEEISMLSPGMFAIKEEGLWGIWDPKAQFSIAPLYHGFCIQKEKYLVGWQGHLFSAWDDQGRNRVRDFPDSLAFLTDHTFAYYFSADPVDSMQQQTQDSTSSSSFENGRKGLLDSLGEVITQPVFDQIQLDRGYIRVQGGDFVGLYDSKGKELFDFIYQNIRIDPRRYIWLNLESTWSVFAYREDSLELMLPFVLRRRGSFEGNVAVVQSVGGMGVLNQFGELVVDTIYEEVFLLNGNAIVRVDADSSSRQIPLTEEGRLATKKRLVIRSATEQAILNEATSAESGPRRRVSDFPRRYGWFLQRNLWGWRDTSNNRIRIPPGFTDVIVYPDLGLTLAYIDIGKAKDRQCALIDHVNGRLLVKPDANINIIYMQDFDRNLLARAQYSTGAFCLVSRRGLISRLKRTAYVGPFSEGVAPACVSLIFAPLPKENDASEPRPAKGLSGQWGYVTDAGRWGAEAKYQALKPFTNGMGIFQLNNKWGALDTAFHEFIPPKYDEILDPAAEYALAQRADSSSQDSLGPRLIATLINQTKIFYLNESGNLLFSRPFEASHDFHQGLAAVKVGNKWGYINRFGQMQIEPQFDRAGDFYHGLARVRNRMRWGFINSQGEYMIESVYQLAGDFVDGIAMVKYKGKYGYLNAKGAWHIRPRFKKASDFANGGAIARAAGWTGVINTKGEWIIPPNFSRIWRRDNGFYRVKRKGVYGYYTAGGDEKLAPHYRLISEDFKDGVAKVFAKDGWGYINEDFDLILPPNYRSVDTFSYQMGLVQQKKLYGVVDQQGQFVVDPTYGSIVVVGYGRFRVRKVNSFYYEDLDIRKNLPQHSMIQARELSLFDKVTGKFGFDLIHDPHESVSVAERKQLLGLMTYDGNILFEPQFETIRYVNGLYKVIKDGEIGYVNHGGDWVFPITDSQKNGPVSRGEKE